MFEPEVALGVNAAADLGEVTYDGTDRADDVAAARANRSCALRRAVVS
jgi:hypothetical protein